MSIKLKGSTDGSVSLDAPADTSPTGTDVSLTLPTSAGSANQFIKNGSTAGELEHSNMVETSTGVGIGTTTPYDSLTIRGTDEQLVFDLDSTSNGDYASIAWNGSSSNLGSGNYSCEIRGYRQASGAHGKLSFLTRDSTNAAVERMHLDEAGNLYMFEGGSSTNRTQLTSIGYAEFNRSDDTNFGLVRFNVSQKAMHVSAGTSGTVSFDIAYNGNVRNTNNSYGAISDLKLKENIVDAESQWDDFKAIRFRKYNFKEETGHETFTQLGVIAQELEQVCPGLVDETPDFDEEGNDLGTTTKSVKYSILTQKALVALQEAMERIETLETKLAAVEAAS
tara:strand:+ start:391 stop:1398 length:1008 start_codon:yes stop_codon:yes gene_type:complete